MTILGADPSATQITEFALHTALASRWTHYIANGLDSSEKLALKNKYSLPKNCPNLQAPILNSELVPALPVVVVKKDNHALSAQQQVGLALAPLGQALNILLTATPSQPELLSLVSDATKILTDSLYHMSKSRRHTVLPHLNKSAKETLLTSQTDTYLFGEALAERLKTAKALQKSGYDLKAPPPAPPTRTPRKKDAGANQKKPTTVGSSQSSSGNRYLNRTGPTRRQGETRSYRGQPPASSHTKYQRNQPR